MIGSFPRRTTSLRLLHTAVLLAVASFALAGCGAGSDVPKGADPKQVDSTAVPETGKCRNLTHEDVAKATNASRIVPCSDPHNAETYAAGNLPAEFKDAEASDAKVSDWGFDNCRKLLEKHVGADQSVLMRSMLTAVYFGPSKNAWADGARWYRCDLVGGGQQGADYVDLPTVTKNLLKEGPSYNPYKPDPDKDRWMVCAKGTKVSSAKVPCSEAHKMRAVAAIKLGEDDTPFPGEAKSKATAKKYCSGWVKAYLGYVDDYDYGYTWFGEDEWKAGNRRAICWAVTDK